MYSIRCQKRNLTKQLNASYQLSANLAKYSSIESQKLFSTLTTEKRVVTNNTNLNFPQIKIADKIHNRSLNLINSRTFVSTNVNYKSTEIPFSEMEEEEQELLTEERGVDTVDVCIVGGGPAGLATAIKLKQLDENEELRVVVLEKGPEIGSHILSGAVLEPRALREFHFSRRRRNEIFN
ncbi:unnamed protein product [[Candida] boidinii]|nr:unnamed protein product [[Candida] boidinii]